MAKKRTKANDLDLFEDVKQRARELEAEASLIEQQIRSGFVELAIVFIDVVGSTAFKQEHAENPETWILRVRQFSELLALSLIHI